VFKIYLKNKNINTLNFLLFTFLFYDYLYYKIYTLDLNILKAATGSGKTLAFLIPIFHIILTKIKSI